MALFFLLSRCAANQQYVQYLVTQKSPECAIEKKGWWIPAFFRQRRMKGGLACLHDSTRAAHRHKKTSCNEPKMSTTVSPLLLPCYKPWSCMRHMLKNGIRWRSSDDGYSYIGLYLDVTQKSLLYAIRKKFFQFLGRNKLRTQQLRNQRKYLSMEGSVNACQK